MFDESPIGVTGIRLVVKELSPSTPSKFAPMHVADPSLLMAQLALIPLVNDVRGAGVSSTLT